MLVVDDHPVFREGFAALLGSIDEVQVVGTASTGREALESVEELAPAVVVMDVQMPGHGRHRGHPPPRRRAPEVGVVVLTMSEDDGTLFDAVRAGARGYLLKGAEPEEVVRAITRWRRAVSSSARPRAARRRVLRPAQESAEPSPSPSCPSASGRCSTSFRAGLSNGQIAARLFLSPKTVRNHVHAVLEKLQAADRSEAIVRARDAGLGR